ncbi:MAG: S-methyl-5'-thioinosine phosphorylase [Bacteroidota bacterium]
MRLAIITGSGMEDFGEKVCQQHLVDTRFGPVLLERGQIGDCELCLIPRHGRRHAVAPHEINYRANMAAIAQLGCQAIIATNAVGSLRPEMKPGDYVLPDQFLDFTRTRPLTFFEGDEGKVHHIDFTAPYCPSLRSTIGDLLRERSLTVHEPATYLCAEGPRFETPAEIRMFSAWGADLVGMTGVPEVVFAHELGLCYASLCIVTNMAAGMTGQQITHEEVSTVMHRVAQTTATVLNDLMELLHPTHNCVCAGTRGRQA